MVVPGADIWAPFGYDRVSIMEDSLGLGGSAVPWTAAQITSSAVCDGRFVVRIGVDSGTSF